MPVASGLPTAWCRPDRSGPRQCSLRSASRQNLRMLFASASNRSTPTSQWAWPVSTFAGPGYGGKSCSKECLKKELRPFLPSDHVNGVFEVEWSFDSIKFRGLGSDRHVGGGIELLV